MSKCNHEKVCNECVKAEIEQLEIQLQKLKDKLPHRDIIIRKEFNPYYIQKIIEYPDIRIMCKI